MSLVKSRTNGFPTFFTDFFNKDLFWDRDWMRENLEKTMPAVNVKEKENEYVIELAVPGYKKGDFKLTVDNNYLTISAETREEKKEEEDKEYTRREFSYSSFNRSFNLPENTNADKIQAKYDNGILNLHIPKKAIEPKQKAKEISVS